MRDPIPARRIRVFVHLAHGFGAHQWRKRWDKGEIIGINDRLPYGYFWAEHDGCDISYSCDRRETILSKSLRLAIRLVLGFDFVHAWRNRKGIRRAEVVWTHTESQYLAVLLILWWRPRAHRPKVIAQSVWLFDEWPRLSPLRRLLFRALISRADLLTVHSPENLRSARGLFPARRSELVLFGIRADERIRRRRRAAHDPVHVLSLGNDRHRDWATLTEALGGWPGCCVQIVAPPGAARHLPIAENVEIVHPRNKSELLALYDWADVVALAIKPNLHASGITVIEEATLCAVPVVCSDTGGLRAYFSEDEIAYVPPSNPEAMRRQVSAVAKDEARRCAMVQRARDRIDKGGLTSRHFARRHAELSRELLGLADVKAARAPAQPQRHDGGVAAVEVGDAHSSFTSRPLQPVDFRDRRIARSPITTWFRACFNAVCCVVLTAATAVSSESAGPTNAASQIDLCSFRPTFTEDFNKLSVSAHGGGGSRWVAHTPWGGDFGDAAFTDPQPGFPFRVENGILEIEARKGDDGKWRSGLLASAPTTTAGLGQHFGYFEMRAQLPAGPGVWPGFWLNTQLPAGSRKPGVEIDVVEYYGQFPQAFHSAIHIWDNANPKASRVEDHITSVPTGSLSNAFHTYGVDVEPDWITFYLDRRETWRQATPVELKEPLIILLDLALGSGWPIDKTPNPSIMKVNYVHVYKRSEADVQPSCVRPQRGANGR